MAKSLTFILVALMALALMLFTASRTLDLLQLLLPANQSVFAFLGLVAFDGGLLGWSLWFAYGARGQYQRAIALLMVILSLIAIGISTIADLMISASAKGLVNALSEQQRLAILLAVGAIVFINVAAFFLTHITDPDRLRAMANENARDVIHAESLRQINAAAPIVASQVAPQLARQWVIETVQQLLPGTTWQGESQPPAIAAPVVNATPGAPAQPAQPIAAAPAQPKRGLWGWLAGKPQPAQPPAMPPAQTPAEQIKALVEALKEQGLTVEIKQTGEAAEKASQNGQGGQTGGASNGSSSF